MGILIAMFGGLTINYLVGGVSFSTALCVFAGVFMIMPSMLRVSSRDLLCLGLYKKYIGWTLLFNVILIPLLAWVLGYVLVPDTPALHYSLVLLGMLSGGGLLPIRVMKTHGDVSLSIKLFIINMLVFALTFIIYDWYVMNFVITTLTQGLICDAEVISSSLSCGVAGSVSPISGIVVLLIIPFILSRIILLFKAFSHRIKRYIHMIARIATFFIVFYIFSLEQLHQIFTTSWELIGRIVIVVSIFYVILIGVSYAVFLQRKTKEYLSLFRLNVTRFITFGMILSFIYTQRFGTDAMLVFIVAYFVQIIFSLGVGYIMNRSKFFG